MATILAHLEVYPGKEAEWEAIMADMVRQTFEKEEQVLRCLLYTSDAADD